MSIAIRSLRPCSGFTAVKSSDSALFLSGNGVLMLGIPAVGGDPFLDFVRDSGTESPDWTCRFGCGWFLLRGKLRKTAKKLKVTFPLGDKSPYSG